MSRLPVEIEYRGRRVAAVSHYYEATATVDFFVDEPPRSWHYAIPVADLDVVGPDHNPSPDPAAVAAAAGSAWPK